ncbi:hypothetical protein SAY86_003507, partial [Trapa natans]
AHGIRHPHSVFPLSTRFLSPATKPLAHRMVHQPSPPPPHGDVQGPSGRSKPAILVSVSALLSLLTKGATQISKRLRHRDQSKGHKPDSSYDCHHKASAGAEAVKSPRTPRSPLTRRPKEMLTNVNNKAIKLVHGGDGGRKKSREGGATGEELEGNFGDGGVWQRAILMGDKCQPLEFSGVIYYDENGRKLSELPLRSPRASPLPGYHERRQNY